MALAAFSLAVALHSITSLVSAQVKARPKLWVGIGVAKPVFEFAEAAQLSVSFVVVNDGKVTADPGIGSSHLFINGVEPRNWNFTINNGPRTQHFTALPPGEVLSFTYQLGTAYCATPGIYVLRWQAGNSQTAETTFRILPNRR